MKSTELELKHHLLDLLVDGPSSFAALFGALIQHYNYSPSFSVDYCLDLLFIMDQEKWVKAYQIKEDGSYHWPCDIDRYKYKKAYNRLLLNTNFSDLSLDEIGLWLKLMPEGRKEWQKWSGEMDGKTEL